jgi:hypothetical protein
MSWYKSASDPANGAAVITPSDTADLPVYARAIYVGVTGHITVDMTDSGTNITFLSVPQGTILPVQVKRVYLTGTTATDLVALL